MSGGRLAPHGAGRGAAGAPTAERLDLVAPAKVNLGLRVVGVREDGYHLLESLFAPLDLHDDLRLELEGAPDGVSRVALELLAAEGDTAVAADVPCDDRNLAVRAAKLFLDAAKLAARVRIVLRKRIPAAAGLGGGSSDAAAVLRGLATAWPDRVEPAVLEALALRLGADVPFFLDPRPSLVSGIGERREALRAWPRLALVLANPRRSVSTAEVFAGWDEVGAATPAGALRRWVERLGEGRAARPDDAAAWRALLQNDLARAAERLCPDMRRLHERLAAAGARATAQSGSGATVFGVFADEAAARTACDLLSVNDSAWFRVAISLAAR